jgi:GTP-binding protein EngB required for normal cell division
MATKKVEKKQPKETKKPRIDHDARLKTIDGWAKDIDTWIEEMKSTVNAIQTKLDKVSNRLGI